MSKERTGGYHEQLPNRHNIGDIYLDRFSSLELLGLDSLEHIRYLHSRGDKLLMMGNHRSNADAPVLEHSLERNGFKDLSDNLVFLLGQKLKTSWGTNYFSSAYSHIDVWPPTMVPTDDAEKKLAHDITKNSLRAAREKLSEGKIISIFPEGTRTRDGNIHSFNSQIARFALGEDIYVIPFALAGTENIWPVSESRPKIGFHKSQARVSIGRPFLSSDYIDGKNGLNAMMQHTEDQVRELYENIK
jgi:1-acyl-sn-glycerol-3-phosphate acyltransferase